MLKLFPNKDLKEIIKWSGDKFILYRICIQKLILRRTFTIRYCVTSGWFHAQIGQSPLVLEEWAYEVHKSVTPYPVVKGTSGGEWTQKTESYRYYCWWEKLFEHEEVNTYIAFGATLLRWFTHKHWCQKPISVAIYSLWWKIFTIAQLVWISEKRSVSTWSQPPVSTISQQARLFSIHILCSRAFIPHACLGSAGRGIRALSGSWSPKQELLAAINHLQVSSDHTYSGLCSGQLRIISKVSSYLGVSWCGVKDRIVNSENGDDS